MPEKEAKARTKINQSLEEADWRMLATACETTIMRVINRVWEK